MTQEILTGLLLDERVELSLTELCTACATSTTWVIELVDEGVLEPIGGRQENWRFSGTHLLRARVATRLHNDLEINLAGVALALDLMEEIEALRKRLCRLDVDDSP